MIRPSMRRPESRGRALRVPVNRSGLTDALGCPQWRVMAAAIGAFAEARLGAAAAAAGREDSGDDDQAVARWVEGLVARGA